MSFQSQRWIVIFVIDSTHASVYISSQLTSVSFKLTIMALNDKNLQTAQGVGVYPGMANPTSSSNPTDPLENNFVTDPTTSDRGAGAGPNFEGDKQARRILKDSTGYADKILETTAVHPLRPDSNDDDGWAHATAKPTGRMPTTTQDAPGIAERAGNVAVGGAKLAYGHLTGDELMKEQGQKAVFGTQDTK
ncbi:G-patch domain-containing protein [Mycena indigotica]|uniref:G-patch domain-containing protein n=1 Tax=Mycena indigotica TaxID=2126181 RepID=A0A8H6S8X1_9AGAR|nr:G-patch domain-containing protein [Mycena indigotica]KAF7295003.1 G-patch domain-containing protein [Mycena indigotica]